MVHGSIILFPFLRFFFFFFPTCAKDHRYFWGFVLCSSVSVPVSNLQCSQNAETLWHGDNFLSNRQCCQQCRFVILTVGYSLGLDLLGGWRLLPAVGSEVCVWQNIHLLSCCAYSFSSCRQSLTCWMMKKDLNRAKVWGQMRGLRIKVISHIFWLKQVFWRVD